MTKPKHVEFRVVNIYSITIWRIIPGRTPSLSGAVCTSNLVAIVWLENCPFRLLSSYGEIYQLLYRRGKKRQKKSRVEVTINDEKKICERKCIWVSHVPCHYIDGYTRISVLMNKSNMRLVKWRISRFPQYHWHLVSVQKDSSCISIIDQSQSSYRQERSWTRLWANNKEVCDSALKNVIPVVSQLWPQEPSCFPNSSGSCTHPGVRNII
jgi:hypothetical protein